MNMIIPAELFNSIDIPADGQDTVRITEYVKAIAYKMPNCSDLMMEREFWNTVCDFAERCGSLREKKTGSLDTNKKLAIGTPTYGDFQRFVGAGIGSDKTPITSVSAESTATGASLTFTNGTSGSSAYAIYTVVPDINAMHDKTGVTSSVTTTYPNDKWIAPKWFLREYDRLLTAGTLFRLFGMSNRPWSDFNSARSNALVYNREINRISHGLITSGMRKQMLVGAEAPFIGNAQAAGQQQQRQ